MAGQETQPKDGGGWGLVRLAYMHLRGRATPSKRLERWEEEAWEDDERQRDAGKERKERFEAARKSHAPKPDAEQADCGQVPGKAGKLERVRACFCERGKGGGDDKPGEGEDKAGEDEADTGKAGEEDKAAEDDSPTPDSLGKLAMKAAGVAVGAIGVTGVLVGVGAVVLWIRFTAAHIPAIQAISVQPKLEALTQGGEQTVIFLLIALAAVLLIYLADPDGIVRWTTTVALAAMWCGATVWALLTNLPWYFSGGLIVVAFLLAIGCASVGLRTARRFWPMGVAVFVSALVFSSAAGILITQDQKFVQAVAVLRGGLAQAIANGEAKGSAKPELETSRNEGLAGIYVAATDETIYIAKFVGDGQDPAMAMMDIPRDSVAYAVGPPEKIDAARDRAPLLLNRLKTSRNRNVAASEKAEEEAAKKPSEGK